MSSASATTDHRVYVVLPRDEHDSPIAYTGILAGSPVVAADDLTPLAALVIDRALLDGPDETTCADCDTAVGHHFLSTGDPEEFRNTGFYVLADGTILCEECGDPDFDDTLTPTMLFKHGRCRVCGHLKGDHEPLGDGRFTCDDDCDEDLNGYCHPGRLSTT